MTLETAQEEGAPIQATHAVRKESDLEIDGSPSI